MRYTYRLGFFWLLVYSLLSLLPMGIALLGKLPPFRSFLEEFGVALGLIGLGMMGIQFLFSGRYPKIAPTFGMDNVVQFHREVGRHLLFLSAGPSHLHAAGQLRLPVIF
ncbi:hypothetical protein [Cesiribacter andamanensis]|uniref:Uncharacterized protein n=1 Tax=Cesiribacter andamanensis AMV16 TaxID=1279009 RepID=M7NBQ3_9BACT|nr:hypothetical protein [Cesiribacter andamanensis]EMR04616.1 hypothetical protein ADICEAN_00218 [Cesiribacter andamanensis AMV16]